MATTHTVVKGDKLWALAIKYNTTVNNLVKLNSIQDPDYIVVGQVLVISGSAVTVAKNTTSRATIRVFGLQSNTDRTVYATWTWDKSNTENYQVKWYYDTGDGVWFIGTDSTVTEKQSVYNAPTNAERVKFIVKPISKKRKINNKETTYWTASWSTAKTYSFSSNPPSAPPVPTVEVENYVLKASVTNLDVGNATHIRFQVYKNDATLYRTGLAKITTSQASYECSIEDGNEYKVRCCSVLIKSGSTDIASAYSDFSTNVTTKPASPSKLTTCRANSETSVYLEWPEVKSATSYDIEYTTNKRYFDGSDATTTVSNIEFTHYEKTGLETGEEYFFRVRAVNEKGKSAWSEISSTTIGTTPIAPTTWSSTTTAISGDSLTLYWVHNSEDESSQTYAELEMYVNGIKETHTIENSTDEDEKDKTSSYAIDTSEFVEGTKIQWRVRTAGITKEYGEWSIQRTIDIYAPATLELSVTDSNGELLETLTSFPFYISGLAGPNTQIPIGYHVVITANESHEAVDNIGNTQMINAGEQVYSKYFDISEELLIEMSAGNVNLENNIEYTVTCTVSMNSGLTASASSEFIVAWTDIEYEPNAEISIDENTYSAHIRPHCEDENGVLIEDILLSVYRREFDGTFTKLADNIDNTSSTFITDPHPALDYARYRVVATTKSTGAVSYCDISDYPVGCNAVIIQWDENWTSFDTANTDELEQPIWSGSMLKLPYNIDVADNHKNDVAHVEYIGRKHPVSYYGTQLGETSTWNMVIDKEDTETLYGLRRLAIWTGDVYVREPSGSGYWASVSVSFSQKHKDVIIPVTIDITRVEGGM